MGRSGRPVLTVGARRLPGWNPSPRRPVLAVSPMQISRAWPSGVVGCRPPWTASVRGSDTRSRGYQFDRPWEGQFVHNRLDQVAGASFDSAVPTENLAYALRTRVPELPSIANDRHHQLPANIKLAPVLSSRATQGDTLVIRSS